MFTYIDPTVRDRLIEQSMIKLIDTRGQELPPDAVPDPADIAIHLLGPIPLPVQRGGIDLMADWYVAVRYTELSRVEQLAGELRRQGGQSLFAALVSPMAVNSVLVLPHMQITSNPLVRVHSNCVTGDVFGSQRCECGPQLQSALERIAADPAGGLVIYMAGHEGRGVGLWAKAVTYLLQDAGENTYQANRSLGLPDDSRDFTDAAALLLRFVGDRPMRLLTNNPKKLTDLADMGLNHITQVKHVSGVGTFNRGYMTAKRAWGHQLDDDDINLKS